MQKAKLQTATHILKAPKKEFLIVLADGHAAWTELPAKHTLVTVFKRKNEHEAMQMFKRQATRGFQFPEIPEEDLRDWVVSFRFNS